MTQIKRHQIDDNNLTGASLINDIGIFDETHSYSVGDIVIWKSTTYKCIASTTGKKEGDLSATPDLDSTHWYINKEDTIFSVFPSAVQTFTNTRITINFNTEDITSTFASASSGEITINKNITLLVGVSLATDVDSGTNRSGSIAYLQLDTGSGYADVSNFEIEMYNRTAGNGKDSGSYLSPIKFSANDKIRVQIIRYDGSNTLKTIPAGCMLTLYNAAGGQGPKGADGDITWEGAWTSKNYTKNQAVEYNGSAYVCIQDTISYENPSNTTYWNLMASKGDKGDTGPTGPSGDLNWTGAYSSSTTYNINDVVESNGSSYVCITNGTLNDQPPSSNWDLVAEKGTDGSGATIVIRDEGTNIPNTPHSTLNFVGNVTATDEGSGVAKISIPAFPFITQYGMSGTQIVDATTRVVPFDTNIRTNSALTLNTSTGRITANQDVTIMVSYNILLVLDSGDTARNTMFAWVQKNGTKLNYTQTAVYTRGYNYDKYGNCACPPTIMTLSNGDYIEVAYIKDDDINSPVIGSAHTWITIQEVK